MSDPKSKDAGEGRQDPNRGRSREDFLSLFKRGQEFTEELLQENERLRFQVASLQEEVAQSRRVMEKDTLVRDLMTQLRALEEDRQRLLDHYRNVQDENRSYNTRYAEIEEAHNNLANLYVSSYQIHSTLEFSDVVQIACEIVLNLIGAEEFAIYVLDEEKGELTPLVAEGRALTDFPAVKLGDGRVGRAVQTRELYVASGKTSGAPGDPLAIIPLCAGERRVGAVVLLKLLVQKPELSTLDHELFALLGTHAATAMVASVQQNAAPVTITRALYERLWRPPAARPEEA